LEVHCVGVREVFKEGQQLNNIVLLDDLDTNGVGCPLLVDGHHHAATGYGEARGDAIELHLETCDSELECMQILEGVECQLAYRRSSCQCPEHVSETVGNVSLCSATVNSNSQVLLGVAKKGELRCAINGQSDKQVTRS
jgi:hypothetical protein